MLFTRLNLTDCFLFIYGLLITAGIRGFLIRVAALSPSTMKLTFSFKISLEGFLINLYLDLRKISLTFAIFELLSSSFEPLAVYSLYPKVRPSND